MPRYVRQTNSNTCAPISIINALKWAGNNEATCRRYLKDLSLSCGCCIFMSKVIGRITLGTTEYTFDIVLASELARKWFAYEKHEHITLNNFTEHVKKKHGAAIVLSNLPMGRHAWFVPEYTDSDLFVGINVYIGWTKFPIYRSTMSSYLRRKDTIVYLLTRKAGKKK